MKALDGRTNSVSVDWGRMIDREGDWAHARRNILRRGVNDTLLTKRESDALSSAQSDGVLIQCVNDFLDSSQDCRKNAGTSIAFLCRGSLACYHDVHVDVPRSARLAP